MTGLVLAFSFILSLQDPRDSIKRLASDRIEDRDAAALELKKLGDRALPALREAAAGTDPEISARCKKILASLELLRTLSPRLFEVFPGLEDRLAQAPDEIWTEVFLEATHEGDANVRLHPRLSRPEHVEGLAARALKGVKDPDTWQKVTRVVEERRLKAAIPVLIENIESDQEPVWRRSIALLGELDAREALPALAGVLRKSATVDRSLVTSVLVQLDRQAAIRELRSHFDEKDPHARLNVLSASSELGDVKAISILISLSQFAETPESHLALMGIERFDPRESLAAFLSHLSHPDSRVRLQIVEALHRTGAKGGIPALIAALRDSDEGVRIISARILGEWKAREAVPGLLDLLGGTDRARDEAVSALARIGDPAAIPALEAQLRKRLPEESQPVIEALSELGSKSAVPGLIGLLSRSDDNLQANTLERLGKLGAPEAIPAVTDFAKGKVGRVRWEAFVALGRLGARDQFPLLLTGFDEPDPTASMFAARGLLYLKDPRVPAALIRVLESGKKPPKNAVIAALKELKCREALPALVADLAASADDFGGTREAIEEIGFPEAIPFAAKAGPQAILKLSFPRRREPSMVPLLVGLLKDPDRNVRAPACWMLEDWGDRRATDDLEPLLRDSDEEVRLAAAFALAALGDARALPAVRAALGHKGPGVRLHAIRSLVWLDPENTVTALKAALEDPDNWVQSGAARGLLQLGRPAAIRALPTLAAHSSRAIRRVAAESLDRMEESASLPTAQSLLEDADPEVRASAAQWLCRKGRAEGIQELLVSLRSRVVLNALRRPDLWARLERPWTHPGFRGYPRDILNQIGIDSGLPLRIAPDLEQWLFNQHFPVIVGDRLSPLEFNPSPESLTLRSVLEDDACRWFGSPSFDVILEEDGLHLVLKEEADKLWKRWRAEWERR